MQQIVRMAFNQRLSRRVLLGTLASATVAGSHASLPNAALADQLTPARSWRPWHLEEPADFRPEPPKPVTSEEIDELVALQDQRNPSIYALVSRWLDQPAVLPWTDVALNLIISSETSAVRSGRALSLLQTALFDAVIAAEDAQHAFPRSRPSTLDPRVLPMRQVQGDRAAYPASEAVAVGAASTVLAYLFPDYPASLLNAMEEEAARALLWSGANVRSDVETGLALGRAIGQRAVAWGEADGSDAYWDGGDRPTGAGYWQPTPPAFVPEPHDPLAGTWRTWVLPAASALRPPAPPAFGTALWQAELAAMQDAVANRTHEQIDAVHFWGGGPGTVTPAGIWTQIASDLIRRDSLTLAGSARVLAHMSVAVYDGFLCCWDAKFTYWYARPVTADPSLETLIPTPPFPSYTSGHSTISAAAATVLASFFPADRSALEARSIEAKNSRLWAGIHFPIDNDMGAVGGSVIGRLVIERARAGTVDNAG